MTGWDLRFRALPGIPLVKPGDDIAALIVRAAQADGLQLADDDVVVVAQKIVSKAEGRIVRFADVTPTPDAMELARITGRDPRLCQLYLDESTAILRIKGRYVITLHKLGFVDTAAGVDMSNAAEPAEESAVLLPVDPDASARRIRDGLRELTGATTAVIVSDSMGRAERQGAVGAAIGIAGIRHLEEARDEPDLYGKPIKVIINRVDEIAGTASILMGQTTAACPVVIGRGVPYTSDEDAAISRLLILPPVPKSRLPEKTV